MAWCSSLLFAFWDYYIYQSISQVIHWIITFSWTSFILSWIVPPRSYPNLIIISFFSSFFLFNRFSFLIYHSHSHTSYNSYNFLCRYSCNCEKCLISFSWTDFAWLYAFSSSLRKVSRRRISILYNGWRRKGENLPDDLHLDVKHVYHGQGERYHRIQ